MRKSLFAAYTMLLVAGSFIGGTYYAHRPDTRNGSNTRRVLYYQDPMHPSYRSGTPGIAPDCGMQLVPVYADSTAHAPETDGAGSHLSAGTVHISMQQQQIVGLRMEAVQDGPSAGVLHTLGRVTADENRVYRVVAGTDGLIREIHGATTGALVQKDELLATFFNREVPGTVQSLLYAVLRMDGFQKEEGQETPVQIRGAEDNLRTLGMDDIQLREIYRTKKLTSEVAVHSPATGLVVARNVSPGLRFDRLAELYRILDLSRVWILADLFENEARFFSPGSQARVTLPHQQKTFMARVSDVQPLFDPETRRFKVRLETDNPGFLLRPDMFVDIELPIAVPAGISVPRNAVLDSGSKKRIFVDCGNGNFEPRVVETGWRIGERVQIISGLRPGERVVVAGNFLLDSESRTKSTAAPAAPTVVAQKTRVSAAGAKSGAPR